MKVGIINKAVEEAKESKHRFGLGAVIFKGGRIFGSGHNGNRYTSTIPERYRKFKNSYHAEISAIINTPNWDKLKGASILVIRLSKDEKLTNSFPCKHCQESLRHLGIKWVYYSTKEGEIKRSKL